MTNWLQRPTMQHILTSLGAVGAGVVLPSCFPTYFPEKSIAVAAINAVSGVGGNLISNFLAKFFDHREADPTRPDINGDLLKLVGNAIAKEIADCSRDDTLLIDQAERSRLFALANKAAGIFEQLMHAEELPDIAPPNVKQLLTDAARDQTLPPIGKVEDWRRLVARLANHGSVDLNINTMVLVAQKLHTHLWESIRSELKKDFTTDGRAYAALHLAFMGDVLATLHTLVQLPREQTQFTQELLEELRAHKASHADSKVHTLLATLAREESERATEFRQRFDSLDTRLDAQFGRVFDEFAKIHTKIDELPQKIAGNLADMLLSHLSEKDQEIGQLKVQLEAALQRAAQAEATGNIDAGAALANLRKDGDPKALGSFLDQQLEEKQADMIELLRERAAVAYVSGEIDRAERCLRKILATLPDDLDATKRLGWIYELHGDLNAASHQYHRLLELVPNDQAWKAIALGNLGLIAQTRGQLDEAERLLQEALTINQQLGHLEGQARALGNLGLIAQTRGQFDNAEGLHHDALEINKQLGRLEGQAIQLANLGLIAQAQGQLDDAECLYQEALTIDQQLGRLERQAIHLGNLGDLARIRGELAAGEDLCRSALTISQRIGSLSLQALQLTTLGEIAEARSKFDEARRLWMEARNLFAHVGMKPAQEQTQKLLDALPPE